MEVISRMDGKKLEFVIVSESNKTFDSIFEKHKKGNENISKMLEYKSKVGG